MGRKPEYPERTHVCTGRTCKLHAGRPPARSGTQDLLAVSVSHGGPYLERQKLAGELFLHTAIPGRA
ncbi:hypothetical protein ATANTOWER_020399 [Ataeniobius toweri]|uniref:Uncharacterized protein n=1 Tax=Ataeniobius toweri TaxID=208326 RepID=A0ABU7B2R9_9TELE|nr:hypothetical protein [Ataeniobius toweri]